MLFSTWLSLKLERQSYFFDFFPTSYQKMMKKVKILKLYF